MKPAGGDEKSGRRRKFGLCRYDSVQNNFSLINRRCESELAQVCRRENISLLPFSPLGGGVLTGKYQDAEPAGARFTEYRRLGERQRRLADRFLNDRTRETVRRLKTIADDLGVTLTRSALHGAASTTSWPPPSSVPPVWSSWRKVWRLLN